MLRETGKSWAEIATHFPNHSAKSCTERWANHLQKRKGPPRNNKKWEEWEERLLISGLYAGLSWKEIKEPITGRTVAGCRNHWLENFHSSDQDEPWTSEELALLAYLRREGIGWDEVSQELPGYTSNACRTQWYKEAEGIQGPSNHHRGNDTWSAEEVEILVALYNTIGNRWHEICKQIPGRTEEACRTWLKTRCTKADGVGGPPSEFWKDFFVSKLAPRKSPFATMLQAESLDESRPGGIDSDAMEVTSDTYIRDALSMPRLTRNQQSSVDARKRKVIDIPMV